MFQNAAGQWDLHYSEFRINGVSNTAPMLVEVFQHWINISEPTKGFHLGLKGALICTCDKLYIDSANKIRVDKATLIIGRVFWDESMPSDQVVALAKDNLAELASFLATHLGWKAVAVDFMSKEFGAYWR